MLHAAHDRENRARSRDRRDSTFPQCLSFTRTTTMVPSSLRTARKRALSDSGVPDVHESDRKKAKKIDTDGHHPITMSSNMSIDRGIQHPQNMLVLILTYYIYFANVTCSSLQSTALWNRLPGYVCLVVSFIDNRISCDESCSIIKSY